MAALGNGGTLYQPQLVLKIQPSDGAPTYEFQPIAQGTLPLKPDQLAVVQEAMHMVTVDCPNCIGTARNRFRGLPAWLKIAGKTGTAEDPGEFGANEPDAWFGGYTFANKDGRPDIAIAVVVSNQGQGSSFAAPVFRRIVEAYFGLNYRLYPWESAIGVSAAATPTPTPDPNATPTP
jgi:penicillin-binding protein 2